MPELVQSVGRRLVLLAVLLGYKSPPFVLFFPFSFTYHDCTVDASVIARLVLTLQVGCANIVM